MSTTIGGILKAWLSCSDKMSKSQNNFITLEDLFSGNNKLLDKAFTPMTIRFYLLQAHYSSPIDFSNEALKAAEQGLSRLMKGMDTLNKLQPSSKSTVDVGILQEKAYEAINDDMNCPVLLGHLFECTRLINAIHDGHEKIDSSGLELLRSFMRTFAFDILGLVEEKQDPEEGLLLDKVIRLLLRMRQNAKNEKDFTTADMIRNDLAALGISVNDTKDGATWEANENNQQTTDNL